MKAIDAPSSTSAAQNWVSRFRLSVDIHVETDLLQTSDQPAGIPLWIKTVEVMTADLLIHDVVMDDMGPMVNMR